MQHSLCSSLVSASGLFEPGLLDEDQAQSLHNPESHVLNKNAGFPKPKQLADLILAEVEDLVPVMAPVLILIIAPLELLRYPTKPIAVAVQVATVSTCTYLQSSPRMDYENAVRELHE